MIPAAFVRHRDENSGAPKRSAAVCMPLFSFTPGLLISCSPRGALSRPSRSSRKTRPRSRGTRACSCPTLPKSLRIVNPKRYGKWFYRLRLFSSNRKLRIPMVTMPASFLRALIFSRTTMIFLKESLIAFSGRSSCSRFSGAGRAKADWI